MWWYQGFQEGEGKKVSGSRGLLKCKLQLEQKQAELSAQGGAW